MNFMIQPNSPVDGQYQVVKDTGKKDAETICTCDDLQTARRIAVCLQFCAVYDTDAILAGMLSVVRTEGK